jgi:hypothetical protein
MLASQRPQVVGVPGRHDPSAQSHGRRYYKGIDGMTTIKVIPIPFASGADTVVSIPSYQYPHGYTVTVTGARVVSSPGAQLLALRNLPGAGHVVLRVTPRST